MLNPLRFDPSLATIRRVLFTSLLRFDALFVVDAGMRWHVSFAFAGTAWVKDVAMIVVPHLLLAWVLLRRQAPSGLAAAAAFPLLATAFIAASAGTFIFDWKKAPVLSFFEHNWYTMLSNWDGNFTALVGAAFHGVAQHTCKRASRTLPSRARALLLIGLGAAWMIALPMVLADPVIFHVDPREPSPELIARIALVRALLWCTLAGIGAVLVVTGFAVLSFRQDP
jgi:hypothetical protein